MSALPIVIGSTNLKGLMNNLKRLSIIFALLAFVVMSAPAANTYVEQGTTHSAVGGLGCVVNAASVATPSVVGCVAAHNLIDGDQVQITGIGGTTTDNTLAYVKVSNQSTTTMALYSDAGLTTGITGTGAYTSGGQVAKAKDVSTLTGDYTLKLAITSMTAAQNAVVCIQGSTDGFVASLVTLECANMTGPVSANAPVWYSWRSYQVPYFVLGTVNARLRVAITGITGGSVTTTLLIEQ